MITCYEARDNCITSAPYQGALGPSVVWIDVLDPTKTEEGSLEKALGIDVPTMAEMREIEVSNRFYTENNAHFMTMLVLQSAGQDAPVLSYVTFILVGNTLVTVRYLEPKAFPIYAERLAREAPAPSGALILMGLLETMIQRQADHIERMQDEIESLAPQIFGQKAAGGARNRRLDAMLRTVGRSGDLTSRTLECLVSLNRTLHFFADAARTRGEDAKLLTRIVSAERDVTALSEHLKSLSGRTAFLLDATLGMISTEQNQIIKLFSVMAVMLMPPTLVASIYGMNFHHMPELDWPYGYPLALCAMVVSAVVPYLYFRRKGWM